ncbi:coiled-coil domain-containing protein 43 [Bacillus rossius redtenbacheri]|uniref:coiled-coil domain-containing protein 43 n=1 Tax=Bacillus rossius redtenbacheri TaxID=93214 RepID=UPI002FDD5D3E
MAAAGDDFDSWLSVKLRALNTDENVFGSYIKGILDGEETLEEKMEALEGILTEIIENDISNHCREILQEWQKSLKADRIADGECAGCGSEVDVTLAKFLESQPKSVAVQRTYTDEERKIREAILAQYSQMSDEEDGTVDESEAKENTLVRNTNVAVVQQAEKEKREKAKVESQKKKDKDKEDRERQKQQQQEKKEKRKTQKGERRR